jgi:amidase
VTDWIFASATSIAQAIREKRLSSEEITRACLERIEAVNPKLNAVVYLRAEQALEAARAADNSEPTGPLHGVPMTIKDSLDTAGIVTTAGTKGRAHYVPNYDATVVARLKSAGAILLGKTNTPELTLGIETDNLVFGRTNNPYNLSRTPGGSSGGAAAIVAAGGSPFDIGTDTGGSIRQPCHFCGLAGIKPTSGRVPRTGHIISYNMGAFDSWTQIGPLARYVQDLMLILPIIAGVDWCDPGIVPMPFENPLDVDLSGLRVAYHTDNGIVPASPEVAAVVQSAVTALDETVVFTTEDRPKVMEGTAGMWLELATADGGAWVQRLLDACGTTEPYPAMARRFLTGNALPSGELTALLSEWDHFRSEMLRFMERYDVIICPVNAYPAMKHGETADVSDAFSYTRIYNLTGWPGVVVRCGTSSQGLPIGVQIVARPWREDVALAVALHLESTLGGYQKPEL